MSHQDKKPKLDREEEEEAKGGTAEAALGEEHEEHAGQVEEHVEQHEADDALEEGYKEELDAAVAALEEVQEKIRGVGVSHAPCTIQRMPCIFCSLGVSWQALSR